MARWLDYSFESSSLSIHRILSRYLFYADDVLIFLEASRANGHHINKLLLDYGTLFEQVYSPSKSQIFYSRKSDAHFRSYIWRCTSIHFGTLPFTYLSVPLFKGAPKCEHLNSIADRGLQKFAWWKDNTLSMVDRKCLINSVIVGSLVHSMMTYKWSGPLLKKLEVAIQNFLWTRTVTKKGFYNVKWSHCPTY